MWYWYHFVGLTKLLEYDFRTRKPKPKTFRCRVVTHKVDTAVFSRFCSRIVMGNMLNCDFCLILPKILAILSLMITEFTHTHTHTTVWRPFSGTTQVSRYQQVKTSLDFTEATDNEWQWHQLGHMQVCTSLQTDNHASTPPLPVFYRTDALPAAQPTASKHWRLNSVT